MYPQTERYDILPRILPAGKESTLSVIPTERCFLFFEGEQINVTVIPVNGDEPDYYKPQSHRQISAVASGGILRFSFFFEAEQEYTVLLSRGEKKIFSSSVYALESDLLPLRPLKGDLHVHSYRSDGGHDPSALMGYYRELGYDFLALTDHNRYYPGDELDEAWAGIRTGMTHVPGEEVHAPNSVVHIVHAGGKRSAAEIYSDRRADYERALADCFSRVPADLPEQYRERYAKAIWATDEIHRAGGLAIFVHPYWRPILSGVHNLCDEFSRILLKSGMFDAIEVIGGADPVGRNRTVNLWAEMRAEGIDLPVVGASDLHVINTSHHYPDLFTVAFAEANAPAEILSSVRAHRSVAVEAQEVSIASGYIYRVYGELRLVSYAQFLLNRYFPAREKLTRSQGALMRALAMGADCRIAVETLADEAESFRARFFGEASPSLPSSELLAFEEKWRARQMAGPTGKGGTVDEDPPTRQI